MWLLCERGFRHKRQDHGASIMLEELGAFVHVTAELKMAEASCICESVSVQPE